MDIDLGAKTAVSVICGPLFTRIAARHLPYPRNTQTLAHDAGSFFIFCFLLRDSEVLDPDHSGQCDRQEWIQVVFVLRKPTLTTDGGLLCSFEFVGRTCSAAII